MAAPDSLDTIRRKADGLCRQYRLTGLYVFGSVARGEQRPDSDVDIAATFEGSPDLRRFMGLKLDLEELLGSRVDLTTLDDIKDFARPSVEKDLVRVA